jgi:hypothetical protein
LQLVSATDRTTKVILIEDDKTVQDGALLRGLARRANLITIRPDSRGEVIWQEAEQEATRTLRAGHLLAISVTNEQYADAIARLIGQLRLEINAPLLPVYCGSLDEGTTPRVRVVFGEIAAQSLEDCKKAIGELGAWIRQNDDSAESEQH